MKRERTVKYGIIRMYGSTIVYYRISNQLKCYIMSTLNDYMAIKYKDEKFTDFILKGSLDKHCRAYGNEGIYQLWTVDKKYLKELLNVLAEVEERLWNEITSQRYNYETLEVMCEIEEECIKMQLDTLEMCNDNIKDDISQSEDDELSNLDLLVKIEEIINIFE